MMRALDFVLRRSTAAILLVGAPVALAPCVSAQARDVAFMHGLGESGSWWNLMKTSIQSQLDIASISPSIASGNSYESQANDLAYFASSLSSAIIVGHSNGGVVGRRYLIANSAPRANGMITIGSPHRGARLALNAANGALDAWFSYVLGSVGAPLALYSWIDPEYGPNNGAEAYTFSVFSNLITVMAAYLESYGYAQAYGSAPVIAQMYPDAAFQVAQNAATALATEASRAPTRYAISTEMPQNRQPYSLFVSNPSVALGVQYALEAHALDMYLHYSFHEDPVLQANAGLWYNMLEALVYIQADWANIQGSITSFSSPVDFGTASNDGVVLKSSSEYPGGINRLMTFGQYGSIPHLVQTSDLAVIQEVANLMRTQFAVPAAPTPPQPPPPTVIVSGASSIRPGEACVYVAGATVGSAPYTFEWYLDGTFIGIGESMFVTIGSAPAFVSVVAYDGSGILGSGGMTISPNPEAPECYAQ